MPYIPINSFKVGSLPEAFISFLKLVSESLTCCETCLNKGFSLPLFAKNVVATSSPLTSCPVLLLIFSAVFSISLILFSSKKSFVNSSKKRIFAAEKCVFTQKSNVKLNQYI